MLSAGLASHSVTVRGIVLGLVLLEEMPSRHRYIIVLKKWLL